MSGFLGGVCVGSIIDYSQSLVEARSCSPISEVLSLFNEKNVSSIPIYQEPVEDESLQSKIYVGIISIVDIVSFVLRKHNDEGIAFDTLFSNTSIESVIGSTTESSLEMSLCVVDTCTPLSDIINKMSQGASAI
jgi:CBS domain-containing protein